MIAKTRTCRLADVRLARRALLSFAASARRRRRKAPDALVKEVSTDVLESVKADKSIQSGDLKKVIALVDQKVMPYVDFQRMTSSAVGRYWRQATPDQQKRLQDEFKLLLVRTYSGALSQVSAGADDRAQADARRSRPTTRSWSAPRSAARAIRSSSTTGSAKAGDSGRSTTST